LAASLAESKHLVSGQKHIPFDFAWLHLPVLMAQVAFQPKFSRARVFFRRRKIDSPVVDTRIQKFNAVNMASISFPDAAHQTNGRLTAGFPNTQREGFFRRERVLGENPCSMSAQHHRGGPFRKNFPCLVRADQDDGDLLRDSPAAAHTAPEQSSTFGGPIATQMDSGSEIGTREVTV
jgi:hypothetical protein